MEIRDVQKNEIREVVEVHKVAFRDFFLTQLGDCFLTAYYECIRKNEKCILLGLYDNNKLCGFCAATSLSKDFNKQLVKKNCLRFLFIGLILLITKPFALIRIIRNFTKTNSDYSDNGEYAELLSIGIHSNKQGFGGGRSLLIKLEEDLLERGCSNISLTTDYNNNEYSIQFYIGLGYSVFYEFIAYPNRKMYRMIKRL